MKSAFPLLALTACLVLSSCATRSASRPRTVDELFVVADVQRDGKVSRDEFVDFLIADAFVRIDKNGDGVVDIVEAEGAGVDAAAFRAANRNGGVTLAQAKANPSIRARMAVPFDEADVNKSGFLTLEEFRAWQERVQPYVR